MTKTTLHFELRNSRTMASNLTMSDLFDRRTEIIDLGKCHGATNVRVFGSIRYSGDRAPYDLDFLVTIEPGGSLFDYVAL